MSSHTNKPTSAAATASLVLAILGIGCFWIFGAIPAIILGIIALGKTTGPSAEMVGRDRAVAGIVLGIIGLFVGLVSMGIWSTILDQSPADESKPDRARIDVARETAELKALATAIQEYSIIEGTYPPNLSVLVPLYLPSAQSITAWNPSTSQFAPYHYRLEGFAEKDRAKTPVLRTPGPGSVEHLVLFADGRVVSTSNESIISQVP